MNAATLPDIDVGTAIDKLVATGLRIKAERDEFEAALLEIRVAADVMLEPAIDLRGAMRGWVKEVRRVADEALKFDALKPAFFKKQI